MLRVGKAYEPPGGSGLPPLWVEWNLAISTSDVALLTRFLATGMAFCGMAFYVLSLFSARAFLRARNTDTPAFLLLLFPSSSLCAALTLRCTRVSAAIACRTIRNTKLSLV